MFVEFETNTMSLLHAAADDVSDITPMLDHDGENSVCIERFSFLVIELKNLRSFSYFFQMHLRLNNLEQQK